MAIEQLHQTKTIRTVADMKFTYVVSCQIYGMQKKSTVLRERSCYQNILNLMLLSVLQLYCSTICNLCIYLFICSIPNSKSFRYPTLRVAYVDEMEETIDGKSVKVYYSVLLKGGDKLDEVLTYFTVFFTCIC